MPKTQFANLDEIKARRGEEIAVSDWLTIEQERINLFAEATGDHQWIHVDVERAKRESPFKAPIAHGYLTVSLLAKFSQECIGMGGVRMGVNYGLNKVRFTSPVRVGSRVRARFTVKDYEDIEGGVQFTWSAIVEIEGQEKPACVAEMLSRWYV
ncbi:MAG: MaoC family dehydratase [Rhodocyclaceae bacterium]|nr:MaoC family dehydratase [Rhodocyclaceae bacterium]